MEKKNFLVLYRYVLSYLFAAIIPLMVIMLFSYNFFISAYQKEIEKNRAASLLMVRNSFDLMLNEMNNIASQIQMEDFFNYSELETDFSSIIKLKNRLYKYKNSSAFIKDILFYTYGSSIICAASSTYSLKEYAVKINVMEGIDAETFQSFLQETDKRFVIPPRNAVMLGVAESNITMFVYPVPYLDSVSFATILFIVETNILRNTMQTADDQNFSAVFSSKPKDVIISSNPKNEYEIHSVLQTVSFTEEQRTFTQKIAGTSYLISYLNNSAEGITYLYVMPIRQALKQVEQIRLYFIIVLFSLFFIESGLLFLLAIKNYRPIKSLNEYILHNFSNTSVADKSGFEIQTAQHLIADLALAHKWLYEQLDMHQKSLKDVLLYKMINGGFASVSELNAVQGKTGIEINKPFLRIVIIKTGEALTNGNDLQDIFQNHFLQATIYQTFFLQTFVLILSEENAEKNELLFSSVCCAIKSSCFKNFYMGISNHYSDISLSYLAYIQANTALDFQEKGEQRYRFYEDIVSDTDIYRYYPHMELAAIQSAILADDEQKFRELVDALVSTLKTHSSNMILAKLVSYDLVNLILKSTLEFRRGFTNINSKALNIMYLSTVHSVNELIEVISSVSEEALKYFGQKEQAKNELMENAIASINGRVYDNSFSIKQLAYQYKMSVNNFSQQFKRYTGQTPSEYMDYLRITQAKYFLVNSDISIRIITEQLGYANESSFIRKFRATIGITPGEYRKKYAKNNKKE